MCPPASGQPNPIAGIALELIWKELDLGMEPDMSMWHQPPVMEAEWSISAYSEPSDRQLPLPVLFLPAEEASLESGGFSELLEYLQVSGQIASGAHNLSDLSDDFWQRTNRKMPRLPPEATMRVWTCALPPSRCSSSFSSPSDRTSLPPSSFPFPTHSSWVERDN